MKNSKSEEPQTAFQEQTRVPGAYSIEASFSQILPLLSDRPLRRYVPRLSENEVRQFAKKSASNKPPQSWHDEDLTGLQ